jgi:DNA-binding NtrC family response regulator
MSYQGAVLVVDDEIAPRESIRMILYPLYQVFTASDGKEALACLHNHEIDLVTLDMKMPGASGMEVLKEIKKMDADVDVIVISGYMTPGNAQEAKKQGAVEVINKPFNVTDIIASVGKFVEQKKYQRKVKDLIHSVQNLGAVDENQIQEMLYN